MKIGKDQKIVFIGDSITDAGRVQPIAEGLFDPLGKGYVTMVEAIVGACHPDLGIRIVNVGNSGNTVRDLKNRWQQHVLDLKPDWVSVMIGVNDVWRQYDLPRVKEAHVYIDEYERTLEELVVKTRPAVKGLLLATPFFIEANRSDPMRATMDKYGAVVKKLAQKHDAIFVDVQGALDEALKHYYSATLAWDRIHPNQTGHMIMARAFLKALDVKW